MLIMAGQTVHIIKARSTAVVYPISKRLGGQTEERTREDGIAHGY